VPLACGSLLASRGGRRSSRGDRGFQVDASQPRRVREL